LAFRHDLSDGTSPRNDWNFVPHLKEILFNMSDSRHIKPKMSDSLYGVAQRKSAENQDSLNALGGKLRRLREEFGISQAELCRRLQRSGWDCDTLVMSRIERGVRSLTDSEMLAILRVLKRKLRDLEDWDRHDGKG